MRYQKTPKAIFIAKRRIASFHGKKEVERVVITAGLILFGLRLLKEAL